MAQNTQRPSSQAVHPGGTPDICCQLCEPTVDMSHDHWKKGLQGIICQAGEDVLLEQTHGLPADASISVYDPLCCPANDWSNLQHRTCLSQTCYTPGLCMKACPGNSQHGLHFADALLPSQPWGTTMIGGAAESWPDNACPRGAVQAYMSVQLQWVVAEHIIQPLKGSFPLALAVMGCLSQELLHQRQLNVSDLDICVA